MECGLQTVIGNRSGMASRLSEFAVRALIEEAEVTPKPALVDRARFLMPISCSASPRWSPLRIRHTRGRSAFTEQRRSLPKSSARLWSLPWFGPVMRGKSFSMRVAISTSPKSAVQRIRLCTARSISSSPRPFSTALSAHRLNPNECVQSPAGPRKPRSAVPADPKGSAFVVFT
jgi:hypothetical protein